MSNSVTVLVPCSISRGMFPNEYAVEIESSTGKISLFADESDLEKINLEQGKAYLKVQFEKEQSDVEKGVLVYLPKESLETGNRWFKLPRKELISK